MVTEQLGLTRAVLQAAELEDLFVHLLRRSVVRNRAIALMKVQHFDVHREPHLRLLWGTIEQLVAARTDLCYRPVWTTCRTRIDEDPQALTPGQVADLLHEPVGGSTSVGLIHHAYRNIHDDDLSDVYGLQLLERFLLERNVAQPLREALASTATVPENLHLLLDRARFDSSLAQSTGSQISSEFLPDDWMPRRLVGSPTGVPFLDAFLPGGQIASETFVVLGPFGGGKTTLAIDLALASAAQFALEHRQDNSKPLRHAYYLGYEDGMENYRLRALSNAAYVPRTFLEQTDGWAEFSRQGQLKAYELEMYARRGIPDPQTNLDCMGEFERVADAKQRLNLNFHIMDMGSERGHGGLQEVVAILEQERAAGRVPGIVVLDYIGVCARRHLAKTSKDAGKAKDLLTEEVNSFPSKAKEQIGKHFGVPVWLMHQYAGAANKKAPGSPMHHTEASQAKSVGENADFCICMGNKDPESRVMRVDCTKARRGGTDGRTTLMQLDGEFARVRAADEDFIFDPTTNRIVSRRLCAEIQGEAAQVRRPRNNHGGTRGAAGLEDLYE